MRAEGQALISLWWPMTEPEGMAWSCNRERSVWISGKGSLRRCSGPGTGSSGKRAWPQAEFKKHLDNALVWSAFRVALCGDRSWTWWSVCVPSSSIFDASKQIWLFRLSYKLQIKWIWLFLSEALLLSVTVCLGYVYVWRPLEPTPWGLGFGVCRGCRQCVAVLKHAVHREAGTRQKLHAVPPAHLSIPAVFLVRRASHEWPRFPETGRELCFRWCSGSLKEQHKISKVKYRFWVPQCSFTRCSTAKRKCRYLFSIR